VTDWWVCTVTAYLSRPWHCAVCTVTTAYIIETAVTQLNVVDKLLRAIANTEYEASQREAALTLSHLCHSADDDDAQLINERIQLVAGPYLHQLILVCIMALYLVK